MKFYFHRKNLVSVSIIFLYPSIFTFSQNSDKQYDLF
nr:MAG TPA: hypothetical protein [Bacteriophage sp.]